MSNAPKTKKISKKKRAYRKGVIAATKRARAKMKLANFGRSGGMTKPRKYKVKDKDWRNTVSMAPAPDTASIDALITAAVLGPPQGPPQVKVTSGEGIDWGEYTRLPLPMLLWCPSCHARHIDEDGRAMSSGAHKTHACQSCGMQWKPANVPTVGVQFLPGAKS